MKTKFKKGQSVAKVIAGAGVQTVTFAKVQKVKGNIGQVCADDDMDEVDNSLRSFNLTTGLAVENWIPGFNSRIVSLEEAKRGLESGYLTLDGGEVAIKTGDTSWAQNQIVDI